MPAIKKIIFGAFVFMAIGFGIWAYFNLKNNKKPKVDALSVLPDQCLVYLHTSNFFELNKKLNSQSLIVDKLKLFKDIDLLCNTLRLFDSLFSAQPLVREEIANNPIHFALYPENSEWLAAFNIKQLGSQQQTADEITKLLHAGKIENNLYEFVLNRHSKLYFAINDGVVVIASGKNIIAQAWNKSLKKLQNNTEFSSFKNTLEENNLLSVYINHELYLKSKVAAALNLPAICRNGASAGMIDLQPSQLKINGFLKPGGNDLVSALANQEPQAGGFETALPLTTGYFQAFGFSNFSKLKSQADLSYPNQSAKFWKVMNDTALYNLQEDFYSNLEDYLVDFENGVAGQKFVMAKITDTLLAKDYLKTMSDSVSRYNGDSVFRIRSYHDKEALRLFSPFSMSTTNYAAIYKSHIYFAKHENELVELLYQLKGGICMTGNESFMSYRSQNFPETFNYLVYDSPGQHKEDRKTFFNFETNSKKDPFENFRHFSFSITNQHNAFKFRWHLLNETETLNKDQNILWALPMDTSCSAKAYSFLNHLSGENEMLLQDDARQLYLVNAKGTILWKKKINEKINSEIFTVDMFKNHKYQALFSTKNYLHLLDRNGNYVQGYPVKLAAEATNALCLFDYDNTRDYRLFIACKNKQVYNYTIAGKKQAGFVTYRTDNEVNLPIKYIKVGLSDYLVAIDEEGKIYTFSRKGDGRIGLKNRTTANCPAFYLDATGNINTTCLVYVDDKNGFINKITLADKKEIVKVNYNIENADINFCRAADGKNTNIIFTKINAVLVYDLNGNLLFNRAFENDLKETDFYADESRSIFLPRSTIRQELLTVDPLKQQVKSYKATSAPLIINLFNDHKKYMVVANGRQLNCVLLN